MWLGLDGALGAFSAAFVASDGTTAPRTATASGNDALERGLALLDEVLGEVPLTALGGLAVGTGPGGFTGLRIALSYAKGLAFAAGLPLAGVSSYDALTPRGVSETHVTFVHGRVGIACARLRIATGGGWIERIACGTYADIAAELAAALPPKTRVVAYGNAEGAASALGERAQTVFPATNDVVVPALAVVRYAIAAGSAGNAHALRADYGEAHYAERPAGTAALRPS